MKRKCLAVAIILLFVGTSIIPIEGSFSIEKEQSVLLKSCFDDIIFNGIMGENGWYTSDVTVTFVGGDYTFFRIDDGNWIVYTGPFVISTDGIHLIEATSDFEHIYNVTIKIDQTPPDVDGGIAKRIGFFKWKFTTTPFDETSGIMIVWFFVEDSLVGADMESPYEIIWSCNFRTLLRLIILINLMGKYWLGLRIMVYDNAGNSAMAFPSKPSIRM